jgi:hypothetical protein
LARAERFLALLGEKALEAVRVKAEEIALHFPLGKK